ncbi:MAG: alpha/beta hydrolase [Lachnospiraceae bacterium]|nr:alpha/beta hydrolase [Lachnospiraceae bacterium]
MKKQKKSGAVLYVHGRGGSAKGAEHYKPLFPDMDVIGLDYQTDTPWETNQEIEAAVTELKGQYDHVILIASSIGAYYSMHADIGKSIDHAYFISPIVDMEKLIADMMSWANVTEEDLKREKTIQTEFGEELSWEYLTYVREHPIHWTTPTDILYGSTDNLQTYETMQAFATKTGSTLTVMQDGEHWFHTEEQMQFLDAWITK